MFRFEIKKLIKRKTFIWIGLFAFLISLLSVFYSYSSGPYIINADISGSYFNFTNSLDMDHQSLSHLNYEDKMAFLKKSLDLSADFIKSREKYNSKINDEKKALDIMKNMHSYVHNIEKLRIDYGIELKGEIKNNWEWTLFEIDYMYKSSTPLSQVSWSNFSGNPVRNIIFYSNLLFGIGGLILIVIFFSFIVSKEKEDGSILLLRSQALGKLKILLAKWVSILIHIVFYILAVLVFSIIIARVIGFEWHNGHLEIYRVFSGENLDYILAYELLIKIIVGYFLLMTFFSAIIIFVSSVSSNSKLATSILASVFLIGYMITKNFHSLESLYNPIHLLRIKESLIGSYYKLGINKGLGIYFLYASLSIIFLWLAYIFLYETKKTKEKVKSKTISSIFKFEFDKLVSNKEFKLFNIVFIIFALIIFLNFYLEDKNLEGRYESGYMAEHFATKLENAKRNKELMSISKPSAKNDNDFDAEIKNAKRDYDEALKGFDYYQNKQGKNFYELQYKIFTDQKIFFSDVTKSGKYTDSSIVESKKLYQYMRNNNIEPVMTNWIIFLSEYEEFRPDASLYYKDNVSSHTASYLPLRTMKTYNMDLVLLIIISFGVLSAYASDKENGRQIELLFTQAVKRSVYNRNKLLGAFLLGTGLLLGIFFLWSILGLISQGLGDLSYPLVHYDKLVDSTTISNINQDYFSLIPIWSYNIRLILSLIVQLFFIVNLGLLVSIFVKEKIQVFTWTSLITGLGMISSKFMPHNLAILSPFSHLRARHIADGSIIIHHSFSNYNILISISVLLIFSAVLFILSEIIIKRREIK